MQFLAFSRDFVGGVARRFAAPCLLVGVLVGAALGQSLPIERTISEGHAANHHWGVFVRLAGDVDGDAYPDLIIQGGQPLFVQIRSGRDDHLIHQLRRDIHFSSQVYPFGDADADGCDDVLVQQVDQALVVSGRTGLELFRVTGVKQPRGVGDLDGDGRPDLGAFDPVGGRIRIYSGRTRAEIWSTSSVVTSAGVEPVGDVNLDGVDDVALYENTPGHMQIRSGCSGQVLWRASLASFVSAVGDLDGDRHADVLARDRLGLVVLSGRDGSLVRRVGVGATRATGVGDYDRDGRGDILCSYPGHSALAGRAWIESGRDGSQLFQVSGTQLGDGLGYSITGGGGFGPRAPHLFAIGVWKHDGPAGVDAGRVQAYLQRAPELADLQPFGEGCLGNNGRPSLSALRGSYPVIGTSFRLDLASLAPGRAASLLVGVSRDRWGALRLPFDLSGFGAPGCVSYCSGDTSIPFATTNGQASWTMTVPNLPGAQFYAQGVSLQPRNALGLVVSNAVAGRVGFSR